MSPFPLFYIQASTITVSYYAPQSITLLFRLISVVCCGLLLLFIHFVFVYLASSRISYQLYSSVFISFSSLSIMLQHTRCGHFPVRLVSILIHYFQYSYSSSNRAVHVS